MKTAVLMATLALGMAGEVVAQVACPCAGLGIQQSNVLTLVSGKTACASRGGDRWQEFHALNGDVIDYKLGPNDKTDPSSKVGTWVAVAATRGSPQNVTYNYGPGQVYSYAVCLPAGNAAAGPFAFCNVATKEVIQPVRLQSGQGPC